MRRYSLPANFVPVQVSKSQICGSWLLVNIDGQPIPNNVNLELQISSLDKLKIKVGSETKRYNWTFNKAGNGIKFQQDSTSVKVWVFTAVENERMSFLDNGRQMNFTRYNATLSKTQEKLIAAKWKIAEVEGVPMPNSETVSRYMEMNSDGKMYFYSNDKKEGECSWGMNSSKTGFFVISGGGTEQWLVYQIDEKEMLLEMDGLKMLLVRYGWEFFLHKYFKRIVLVNARNRQKHCYLKKDRIAQRRSAKKYKQGKITIREIFKCGLVKSIMKCDWPITNFGESFSKFYEFLIISVTNIY